MIVKESNRGKVPYELPYLDLDDKYVVLDASYMHM